MRVRKLILVSAVLTAVVASGLFAAGSPERDEPYYGGPGMAMRGEPMSGREGFHGRPGFGRADQDRPVERRTVEEARKVATATLTRFGHGDFTIAHTTEFDLGYYVAVAKPDGAGAIELVVPAYDGLDAARPAPTMMWNTEFGRRRFAAEEAKEPPVSASKARQNLDGFLANLNAGYSTAGLPRSFPGYYSFDVAKAGKTVAVASVNGYTGEVLLHNWLGSAR